MSQEGKQLRMRYQVLILEGDYRDGVFFRRTVPGKVYCYGSSRSLEGAVALAVAAPFWYKDLVVVKDMETGRWELVKRGMVEAPESVL